MISEGRHAAWNRPPLDEMQVAAEVHGFVFHRLRVGDLQHAREGRVLFLEVRDPGVEHLQGRRVDKAFGVRHVRRPGVGHKLKL